MICKVWGFRNSETSLQFLGVSEFRKHLCMGSLGVSEIRKHLCVFQGFPNFGNFFVFFSGIRISETFLCSLGVSEIRKHLFIL